VAGIPAGNITATGTVVGNAAGDASANAVREAAGDAGANAVREAAGGNIRLRMLLKPGAESHSFEPSPQDIIAIQQSDVFIYGGGENDAWVDRILASMDTTGKKIITLMECVKPVEEEIVEGMILSDAEEEPAYDAHVWTSPENAKRIVERISQTLCEVDPANAGFYRANTAACLEELDALDAEFRSIVSGGVRHTLVFADRFPFRYFTDAYGLDYYAAFPGCSTDTEPSAAGVAFLVTKVRAEKIPVVLYIEFSNGRMADAVSEETGAEKQLFHSAHNVSRDDLAAGATYLYIMRRNAEVLRKALW
jgi:zinc transport system substrate-binding protein